MNGYLREDGSRSDRVDGQEGHEEQGEGRERWTAQVSYPTAGRPSERTDRCEGYVRTVCGLGPCLNEGRVGRAEGHKEGGVMVLRSNSNST